MAFGMKTYKVNKEPENAVIKGSRWDSWVTVWSCSLISFLVVGLTRCNGLLFTSLLDLTGGTRALISLPFNVSGAAMVFVAPLTGYLNGRFTARYLCLVGSLLFALGTAACYLCTNIFYLAFFFGIIRGSGMIITTNVVPVVVHRHFLKDKAAAMGLATVGSPLGALVFPPLVHLLLLQYGLRGTFLLIGGTALHAAIGSLTLRKPPPQMDECVPGKLSQLATYKKSDKNRTNASVVSTECELKHRSDEMNKITEPGNENSINSPGKPSDNSQQCTEVQSYQKNIGARISIDNPDFKNGERDNNLKSSPHFRKTLRNIFTTRGFYIIALQQVLNIYFAGTYYLVIVDYVRDKGGISTSKAVFMLTAFSIGEVSGKLGLGWATDKKILRPQTYLSLTVFISACMIALVMHSSSYMPLMFCAVILGVAQGTTQSVTNVLYAEYLVKADVAMAISFTRSVNGAASLARSLVIGYFRDTLGSYDVLFILLSGLFLFSAIIWALESIFLYCKQRGKPS